MVDIIKIFTILQKLNLDNKLLVSTTLFVKGTITEKLEENKYIKGLNKLYEWCLENNYILNLF